MIDFVMEAKRGFKISGDWDGDFGISSRGIYFSDAINNPELTSISAEYSKELAQAFVLRLQQLFGESGERYIKGSYIDMNFINLILRKLDKNGNRHQVIRLIKEAD